MENKKRPRIDPNALYTREDVMNLLNISETELTNMVKAKRLPNIRTGNRYLWPGFAVLSSLVTPSRLKPTSKVKVKQDEEEKQTH